MQDFNEWILWTNQYTDKTAVKSLGFSRIYGPFWTNWHVSQLKQYTYKNRFKSGFKIRHGLLYLFSTPKRGSNPGKMMLHCVLPCSFFHILKIFETLLEPKTCWVIRIQNPKFMKVHTSKKVIIKVVYRSAALKRTLSNSTFTNVQKNFTFDFALLLNQMVQNYKPISYFHSNDYWSFSKGTDKEKRQRGKERKWDLNDTLHIHYSFQYFFSSTFCCKLWKKKFMIVIIQKTKQTWTKD